MNKKKFYLALIIFSLVGQIAWVVENMYFNVFIYKMFNATADNIALMVQASAVAATLTTVFIGALSDKIGKRKIFMCAGYIAWGVSILAFALVRVDVISGIFGATANAAAIGVAIVIILDCIMTFFGSSANDAAYNAWLTDNTDQTNRGKAEGLNSMMPLLAILVVFGGFMGFDLDKASSWTAIYIIIGAIVLIIGILGFFIVEDAPKTERDDLGYFKTILYGFRPSVIKQNAPMYLTLAAFVVFGVSIQVFMPYLLIYYEQTLGMSDYVLIMAPAIIVAAVMTALYGKVIDKNGFFGSVFIPLGALCAGYVLLFVFPGIVSVSGVLMKITVFIGSMLMMCGYLCGMAVFGAKLRNDTPEGMAGRFQGLRIIGQVLIPGVVGPAIGAAVLRDAETITNGDGTTSFLPSNMIFLAALIVAAVLCAAIAVYLVIKKRKIK
ncbi:MAG: MFS transporter [Clostridia bacterium]|nr:MFS transporter [Clostridia bacterium]